MTSFDMLANMTSRNISDYIVKTNKAFYKKRYGGFEFGVRNNFKDLNVTAVQNNLALILEKLPVPNEFGAKSVIAETAAGYLDDLTKRKLDHVKVWFNNKGWTTSVGYLNAVNNIILRASIKAQEDNLDNLDDVDFDNFDGGFNEIKDESQYGISVINHPMNFTESQLNAKNM